MGRAPDSDRASQQRARGRAIAEGLSGITTGAPGEPSEYRVYETDRRLAQVGEGAVTHTSTAGGPIHPIAQAGSQARVAYGHGVMCPTCGTTGEPSGATWTATPPVGPGWYWVMPGGTGGPDVMRFHDGEWGEEWWVWYADDPVSVKGARFWPIPIEPPGEGA